jgi:hypothetical protein
MYRAELSVTLSQTLFDAFSSSWHHFCSAQQLQLMAQVAQPLPQCGWQQLLITTLHLMQGQNGRHERQAVLWCDLWELYWPSNEL